MFFSASIAVVSALSLSAFSAPLASRARLNPQFCTGTNGSGTCKPITLESCTNTPGVQSLVLNADADCAAFPAMNDYNIKANPNLTQLRAWSCTCETNGVVALKLMVERLREHQW
ncbi:hypothetical protein R3P38DRAFT_3199289 [Favolaschia claudopus]|uniref:Uncharacterized protein n=1 Tax=Favolaschia claudopus TaxID=2862362 RepID=A0AAW0B254_9AGAR